MDKPTTSSSGNAQVPRPAADGEGMDHNRTAVAYLRARDAQTAARQLVTLVQLADTLGADLAAVFTDIGSSSRTGYAAMLGHLDAQRPAYVLAVQPESFTRDLSTALNLIDRAERAGATVATAMTGVMRRVSWLYGLLTGEDK